MHTLCNCTLSYTTALSINGLKKEYVADVQVFSVISSGGEFSLLHGLVAWSSVYLNSQSDIKLKITLLEELETLPIQVYWPVDRFLFLSKIY